MAYNHEYPYVDPNRYNSDWELNEVKSLRNEMNTFEALNKITFSGEWDITKQYPAWTIVNTNGGTEGYISIKPVPAGVTIDNTEYWRFVANYTNVLADLQNRVIDLEGDVATLQNDLQHVHDRKYVFVSDSYGASVVPELVQMLDLSASDYVSIQQGGSGFGATYGTNLNWQTMIENTTTTDDDTFTDVVYIGGINEGSVPIADVTTNAANCFDYVKGRFINAKQWYMFAGHASGGSADTYNLDTNIRARRRIPAALNDTGKAFIYNECWYPMADRNNQGADYLHPNATGAKLLAGEIASLLHGGSVNYQTDLHEAVTLDTTATGNTADWFQLNIYRQNSHVHGIFRADSITLGTDVYITSTGTDIILGSISADLIRGGNNMSNGTMDLFLGSTLVLVSDSSNNQRYLPCKIMLTADNELKLNFTPAWNTAPPIGVHVVDLRYFEFDIDDYIH